MKLPRPAAAAVLTGATLGALFLTGCGPDEPTSTAISDSQIESQLDGFVTTTTTAAPTNSHPRYEGTVYETYLDTLDRYRITYASDQAAVEAAGAVCYLAGEYGAEAVEPVLSSLQDAGYTRREAVLIAEAAIETC